MKFTPTAIDGACLVELTPHQDDRGFFARGFCRQTFEDQGLDGEIVQANISYNCHRGTVRGMHYQVAPATECKFVRCIRGSILDVIVDLREGSPTYLQSVSAELTALNRHALYVPSLCAHGFQTLEDDTEVLYMVTGYYTPECERGVRYNDAALGINWPLPVSELSDKDASWPVLSTEKAR